MSSSQLYVSAIKFKLHTEQQQNMKKKNKIKNDDVKHPMRQANGKRSGHKLSQLPFVIVFYLDKFVIILWYIQLLAIFSN